MCSIKDVSKLPMHMTSLTFQQQAEMGNANSTVCKPIPFDDILYHPSKRFTSKSVRKYLWQVIEKMNQYFAILMDGPSMCKLRVTRQGTKTAEVAVNMSVWRAKQLFPRMVHCKWIENDKPKVLFRNVIDLFLQSRNRREMYHEPQAFAGAPLQESYVIEWLKTQLSLPEECCPIKWGGLNTRQLLYDSFLENMPHPEQWSARRISQEFYKTLPSSRPTKRVRRSGVAVMYLPTRDRCSLIVDRWDQKYGKNVHLNF